MPRTEHGDLEEGGNSGPLTGKCHFDMSPPISQTRIVDDHCDQPQSTSNQTTQDQPLRPSQGESDYDDSSRPLYSMYSDMAKDRDNKTVQRCQNEADGTLIFVSTHVSLQIIPHINCET
jgi:hypothetical protein